MPHDKVRGHSSAKWVENNVNSSAFLQNFFTGRLDINKSVNSTLTKFEALNSCQELTTNFFQLFQDGIQDGWSHAFMYYTLYQMAKEAFWMAIIP